MKSFRIFYLIWIFIQFKCFEADNNVAEEFFDLKLHKENSKLHSNIAILVSKNSKLQTDNSNCWQSLNNVVNHNEAWNSSCLSFSQQLATVMNDLKTVVAIMEPIIDQFNKEFRKTCYGTEIPSSCNEASTARINGIYLLQLQYPPKQPPFNVACDFEISDDEDGWIIIQRRFDGSVDFYRSWLEYKEGFGNMDGEHFIGLKYLRLLTAYQPHELRIEMQDFKNVTKHANYEHFVLGNEASDYQIEELYGYSGNAGDSLFDCLHHPFSTYDHGRYSNCARDQKGAWWFNYCDYCNLNGPFHDEEPEGLTSIFWWGFYGNWYTKLKSVKIMIRPKLN